MTSASFNGVPWLSPIAASGAISSKANRPASSMMASTRSSLSWSNRPVSIASLKPATCFKTCGQSPIPVRDTYYCLSRDNLAPQARQEHGGFRNWLFHKGRSRFCRRRIGQRAGSAKRLINPIGTIGDILFTGCSSIVHLLQIKPAGRRHRTTFLAITRFKVPPQDRFLSSAPHRRILANRPASVLDYVETTALMR